MTSSTAERQLDGVADVINVTSWDSVWTDDAADSACSDETPAAAADDGHQDVHAAPASTRRVAMSHGRQCHLSAHCSATWSPCTGEMVYSLLSILGTHNRDDMSRTLLAMSTSRDSCVVMRQSGCLPLLVQLIHDTDADSSVMASCDHVDTEIRGRACAALRNVVMASSCDDDVTSRHEVRVLRLLEQLRAYCDRLRSVTSSPTALSDVMSDVHQLQPGPAIATLMKLSFDEQHRHAICELGGLQSIAELLYVEHDIVGSTQHVYSVTMRRYACMALTNLTFGDVATKSLLCSMSGALHALVAQLDASSDDLCQVSASVLRNLSWQPDLASRRALRDADTTRALLRAAMTSSRRESTLRSVLSALWNVTSHSADNKAQVCAVDGALTFIVALLTYRSPSTGLAVVESAGGVLRNVSSHVAVHDEYRAVLRHAGCLVVLLRQLRSASLTVVSNACGTLWNLSARCTRDQLTLIELGAVPMLRNLVHSRHRLISMGSAAALKNLLTAAAALSLDTPLLTDESLSTVRLDRRRQRALERSVADTLPSARHLPSPSTHHPTSHLPRSVSSYTTRERPPHATTVRRVEDDDDCLLASAAVSRRFLKSVSRAAMTPPAPDTQSDGAGNIRPHDNCDTPHTGTSAALTSPTPVVAVTCTRGDDDAARLTCDDDESADVVSLLEQNVNSVLRALETGVSGSTTSSSELRLLDDETLSLVSGHQDDDDDAATPDDSAGDDAVSSRTYEVDSTPPPSSSPLPCRPRIVKPPTDCSCSSAPARRYDARTVRGRRKALYTVTQTSAAAGCIRPSAAKSSAAAASKQSDVVVVKSVVNRPSAATNQVSQKRPSPTVALVRRTTSAQRVQPPCQRPTSVRAGRQSTLSSPPVTSASATASGRQARSVSRVKQQTTSSSVCTSTSASVVSAPSARTATTTTTTARAKTVSSVRTSSVVSSRRVPSSAVKSRPSAAGATNSAERTRPVSPPPPPPCDRTDDESTDVVTVTGALTRTSTYDKLDDVPQSSPILTDVTRTDVTHTEISASDWKLVADDDVTSTSTGITGVVPSPTARLNAAAGRKFALGALWRRSESASCDQQTSIGKRRRSFSWWRRAPANPSVTASRCDDTRVSMCRVAPFNYRPTPPPSLSSSTGGTCVASSLPASHQTKTAMLLERRQKRLQQSAAVLSANNFLVTTV